MKKSFKSIRLVVWVALNFVSLSLNLNFALAGVMSITDSRLDDLSMTPNIGRGYSPATNTFQSLCFNDITVTKSSSDFEYIYEEINDDWWEQYKTSNSLEGSFIYNFVESKFHTYGTSKTKTWLLARIQLKKYYSAMNENASIMSSAAKTLLTSGPKQDLIAFFSVCGPYYVRSLNRLSSFYALLSYETANSDSDEAKQFRLRIESKMQGIQTEADDQTFNQEANVKKLRIFISGVGLSAEALSGLLATDIKTFRAAIANALAAMSDSDVGRIIAMELSPWTEHLEFQSIVGAMEVHDGSGSVVAPWLAKIYQEQNSDLVAQVARVRKQYLANIYKAKSCKAELIYNWVENGEIDSLSQFWFLKINDKNKSKNGREFYQELEKVLTLYKSAHDQLIALSRGCFDYLQREEVFSSRPYYEVSNCQRLEFHLSMPVKVEILNYCMPQLKQ
ncbi:MAG: hypothetical protein HQK50_14315 [Oligoflexia bacterium]|nr:hypothetical protein [Oligoflexia bacterium]